ncbi:MAG: hypothetical protein HFH68_01930 [Lachnospiraceae bacterium]|nr:hypothetical protein [Lachnospiraceae bacterium]
MCFFKKRALYIITVFMLFMAACLISSRNVQASSAVVNVTANNSNVVKGDTVYVIITITSSDEIGGFKGYFSYDNSVLKYVTGGSVASGNDDEFLISDTDRESGSYRLKYAVKFTARAAGNTTIMLKSPYSVYGYGDNTEEMSVSYSPLNIVVSPKKEKPPEVTKKPVSTKKPAATKKPAVTEEPPALPSPAVYNNSGSARLRSLNIKDVTLSPAFSPDIYKYSSIVYTDNTSLDISYETEDMDADVTIKGNGGLSEGKNTIKIIVSNSIGKKAVYKLSVKVKHEEVQYSGNISTSLRNGSIVLKTSDEYTVAELKDKELIPEGFGETEMKMDGQVIKVYSSESDTEHKFVLIYCKRGDNKPEFYLYDKEEQSLMPYTKVQSWYRGVNGNAVVAEEPEVSVEKQRLIYILAIVIIICLLLVIIIISVYMHFKGMDKDDLSDILK